MRKIVSNKYTKFNPVYVFHGVHGEMIMMDTATSQPVASPTLASETAPAPTQTLASETAPAPTPTLTLISEALPPYASPAPPQANVQPIAYAEPVFMASPTPAPTQTQSQTTTNTTTSAPKPTTGIPVMPMGGGGGGMPSKPSTTTKTESKPDGTITNKNIETKTGMSMGSKIGIVALIAVIGFVAYKNRTKLGF